MKNQRPRRIWFCALQIFLPVFFLFPPSYSRAEEPKTISKLAFNKNVNYFNTQLGFRFDSPKDWYGVVQAFDPKSGKPIYTSIPQGTKALYLKYSGDEEKKHPFNPSLEVRVFPKNNPGTSIDLMKYYVGKIKPENFLKQPEPVKIGTNEWAVSVYGLSSQVGAVIRKVYLLVRGDTILLFQMTSTEKEFETDYKTFDLAIAAMRFGKDYMELVTQKPGS